MIKMRWILVCGAMVFLGLASTSTLAQYATEVIDSSPSPSPENVLGEPDCSNGADFNDDGQGNPGFVTVGFGYPLYDGPDNDVVVVLTGFQPGAQFNEAFDVLATAQDGTETLLGSRNPNDFNFAPLEVVTFGFDLADGGLTSATAITIRQQFIYTNTNSEGADLCGFEALHLLVPPAELISDLILEVMNLNLSSGIENSFDKKLENALAALDDSNGDNDQSAINRLEAFINQVNAQRGNELSEEDADRLIELAQAIIDAIEFG